MGCSKIGGAKLGEAPPTTPPPPPPAPTPPPAGMRVKFGERGRPSSCKVGLFELFRSIGGRLCVPREVGISTIFSTSTGTSAILSTTFSTSTGDVPVVPAFGLPLKLWLKLCARPLSSAGDWGAVWRQVAIRL
jgi:hypothetical protein